MSKKNLYYIGRLLQESGQYIKVFCRVSKQSYAGTLQDEFAYNNYPMFYADGFRRADKSEIKPYSIILEEGDD